MAATISQQARASRGPLAVRVSTIVMIGFAVLFGLLAVFIAQSWLDSQTEMRMRNLEANKKQITTQMIVVASKSLRFGSELGSTSLSEMPWPQDSVPAGAFSSIAELTAGGRRVVLTAIEANEPVLASKITGPGQRATLSAMIADGMRAVTIRVNDVEGVAGFVLPGDRVDVTLTRQGEARGSEKNSSTNDVVLQGVKVLAIDQMADERADKPSIARAVTLEVDATDAQRVALASQIGTMSLMLRRAGEATAADTRRVTISDLGYSNTPVQAEPEEQPRFATIGVRRAGKRDDVSVPMEDALSTVGTGARGRARK
jgi:pilus assembly protein CpaB